MSLPNRSFFLGRSFNCDHPETVLSRAPSPVSRSVLESPEFPGFGAGASKLDSDF